MKKKMKCCLIYLFVVFFAVVSIPDDAFGIASERKLLQTKMPCSVNFEFQNYTIITSQCKGPDYTPKLCCGALKEFACPFANEINDLTNACAVTMFNYITQNGNYPPGLFANVCVEDRIKGLLCPSNSSSPSMIASGINTYRINGEKMPLLVIPFSCLMMLLCL